jgi:peptide deformylase
VQTIRLFGDPVLRTPAEPVIDFDKELRQLVADLTETMQDAPGVGLAAPQIGVGLRVFTWNIEGEVGHLVNPVLDLSEETQDGDEGCLSVPGIWAPTVRAMHCAAEGFDVDGKPLRLEGDGLMARCLQHEVDHLDGKVFLDRLTGEARKSALRALRDR